MERRKVQTLVLGAGPGGYVAAIRAAQLGLEVAVVEERYLGGVCLNVGCIPSKALIHAASLFDDVARLGPEMGIAAEGLRADLERMVAWKEKVVRRLTGGVGTLLEKNGAQVIFGRASFVSPGVVRVEGEAGAMEIEYGDVIVASGSVPVELPEFKVDGEKVLGSTEALARRELPGRVVVLGGGYIGLEIGTVWAKLGSSVTVVELTDSILPGVERDCAQQVARSLKKRKIDVRTSTRAVGMDDAPGGGVRVRVEGPKGEDVIECDVVLSTVGRRPCADGLGLERIGLSPDEKGFLPTDTKQRTAVPHVYAIGDVAGQPMLAHKASHEGIVAAEVIAGRPAARDWKVVPAVVFTDPEIASVGLDEQQAAERGMDVVVGKFPFGASGRALTLGHADGFCKLVAEKGSGLVVGCHIVGPHASEIIGEAGLAIEMGATLEDLALTVHAHPTLPEVLMEAAEEALGHPVHVLPRR